MFHTREATAIKTLQMPRVNAPRIWSVPAIHGDLSQLITLHDHIYEQFRTGDQLIYHGNVIGYGVESAACIDEILIFRRMVLSKPGVLPQDFTYLRGSQEDLWQKLQQIAFTPNPVDALLWLLGSGVAGTLKSYGYCQHEALEACQHGTVALTRWTNRIRETIRTSPGHEQFYMSLKRAAQTCEAGVEPLLFVHAGLDASKTLGQQGNAFWYGAENFEAMRNAYQPFQKIIRGHDPLRKGTDFNCIKATVDNGCGFGGNLMSAAFFPDGSLDGVLEI